MPNAILRAGPFASSSDRFLNEPDEPSPSILPVNCANDTSSSAWPWKYNEVKTTDNSNHIGCTIPTDPGEPSQPDIGPGTKLNSSSYETATGGFTMTHSASSNYVTIITLNLLFKYQAAQSFQIKVTFSGVASASSLPSGSGAFDPSGS